MEYMDETTGEATFVSRFGTSDEPEQPWFDQTCGRTVSLKMLIVTELLSNLNLDISYVSRIKNILKFYIHLS